MPEEKIPVGTILILRDDFERIARDEKYLDATRQRASIAIRLLDELMRYREKEAGKQ